VEVRVSPHRHSQSLSRDVPSTIRLPSAIRCVDKDDEKSTKNTKIGEEENIFCRRRRLRLASSRSPRLFGASQKSFFSSARKAARLCVRRRCDRVFFFFAREKEEKEKNFRTKVQCKILSKPSPPQIFRHSSLFWKNWITSVLVTTTNDSREDQNPHDVYNKKELSLITRS
jgi:hypothetical protein